jgi:hypothetical protein
MLFNQFVLAPWIGDGSPAEQTLWIDNLTVATEAPTDMKKPASPTNLIVY